ncbi:DUF2285 domain-containing protein [Roseospira goensis]|uniref:T6SS Transcription factor RovC-like DNA binding domain-containing protein n=1 Tax=Roseospira goensis TaxID=391922 RepID=A0A7W6WMH8_9PROT|nr:DUF2285 domain-containing protein [Roseospira goensis]MBB4287954.1 hypothetical protein [Roseospira goensis]
MAEERPLIGGCDFPVDPDIAAPSAHVFWRPEIASAVVTLVAALPDLGLRSLSFADNIADLRTDDRGLFWMRLQNGAVLVGADTDTDAESLGVLIPLDEDWPIRVAAADRLRRRLIERTADPPLTRQQRERLKRALRTVDGRRDGASYRTVATVFFGARRVAEEPWKTSSLKAQVARRAAHGRMLINHGYIRLLKGR